MAADADLGPSYCLECGFVIDRDPYVRQYEFYRDAENRASVRRYFFAYYYTWCYATAYGIIIDNEAEATAVAELGSAENPIVFEDDAPDTRN